MLPELVSAGPLSNIGLILPCSLLADRTIILWEKFNFYPIYSLFVGTQVQRSEDRGQLLVPFFCVCPRESTLKSSGWAADACTH